MDTEEKQISQQADEQTPIDTQSLIDKQPKSGEEPTGRGFVSQYPLFIRVVAGSLAVLIFAQVWLFNASTVRFVREKFAGTEYSDMADYVAENDEYLEASRLEQMRSYIRAMGTPKTYEQFALCASVAIAEENYTKAAGYLEKCIETYQGELQGEAELYLKLGCVYGLDSRWGLAKNRLALAAKLNPASSSAWLMLAESSLRLGDYETALAAMETYGTLETLTADHLMAMVSMQLGLERGKDAVETCTKLLEMPQCDRASALYSRAQGYLLMGDAVHAEQDLQDYLASGGNEKGARLIRAICLDTIGQYTDALKAYRQIIDEDGADITLLEQATQCAYLAEDYDTMAALAEQALTADQSPEHALVFRKWLGVAQLERGDYAEAETNLTIYMDNSETTEEIYYLRGLSRMAQGKYEAAVEDYTLGLTSEQMADECLYNRALCYVNLGDAVRASEDFGLILMRNSNPAIVELTKELLEVDEVQ